MIYAFYRILYGEDFIKESLNSILPHVDKVFVFWTDKFFGDVSEVIYKNELIKFPEKIDNVIEVIREMNNPKIELIYDHRPNNENHFTERVNTYILPHHPKPDYILFMEPDFIYPTEDFKLALTEMQPLIKQGYYWFSTSQIEYWKTPKYTVPRMGERLSAIWWYIKDLEQIPPTGFHANVHDGENFAWLKSRTHNLGFCVSDNAMFWKHMGSLAYSNLINDAFPNEMWYEEKWRDWEYDHNGKNYEISLGEEHMIPFISISDELDWIDLPEELLERFELY